MYNEVLYRKLPKISLVIRRRRLQFAGHCIRAEKQCISKLILWHPPGNVTRGQGNIMTYPKLLLKDLTGIAVTYEDIKNLAMDREHWKSILDSIN